LTDVQKHVSIIPTIEHSVWELAKLLEWHEEVLHHQPVINNAQHTLFNDAGKIQMTTHVITLLSGFNIAWREHKTWLGLGKRSGPHARAKIPDGQSESPKMKIDAFLAPRRAAIEALDLGPCPAVSLPLTPLCPLYYMSPLTLTLQDFAGREL
jgi:hypothetical protein